MTNSAGNLAMFRRGVTAEHTHPVCENERDVLKLWVAQAFSRWTEVARWRESNIVPPSPYIAGETPLKEHGFVFFDFCGLSTANCASLVCIVN